MPALPNDRVVRAKLRADSSQAQNSRRVDMCAAQLASKVVATERARHNAQGHKHKLSDMTCKAFRSSLWNTEMEARREASSGKKQARGAFQNNLWGTRVALRGLPKSSFGRSQNRVRPRHRVRWAESVRSSVEGTAGDAAKLYMMRFQVPKSSFGGIAWAVARGRTARQAD